MIKQSYLIEIRNQRRAILEVSIVMEDQGREMLRAGRGIRRTFRTMAGVMAPDPNLGEFFDRIEHPYGRVVRGF